MPEFLRPGRFRFRGTSSLADEPNQTLGIREQAAWMRSRNPQFCCEITKGLLTCRGLQPGPMKGTYDVVIQFRVGTWPRVFCRAIKYDRLSPAARFRYRPGQAVPVLSQSGFLAVGYEVVAHDRPWLSLWLTFYEMWRVTGAWYGGGSLTGRWRN